MASAFELKLNKVQAHAVKASRKIKSTLWQHDARRYPIFTWVVWGDIHVREAIASAVLMACHCRRLWPDARYRVVVLGGDISPQIPMAVAKLPDDVQPELELRRDVQRPENPCLYDVARMKVLAEYPDKHVVYVDSDVYCIAPLDLAELTGACTIFALGAARGFVSDVTMHAHVEELIGRPSTVLYRDAGIQKQDYNPGVFWPWLRMNIGLFHRGLEVGPFFEDFTRRYEECHRPFERERLFGTGEIIFTSLMHAGALPGFQINFEAGWANVWPFVSHLENCPQVLVDDEGHCVGFEPKGKSPLLHVGHFTHIHLHGKVHGDRPIQMSINDSGKIIATVRDDKNVTLRVKAFDRL